jgi:hypothetical protein
MVVEQALLRVLLRVLEQVRVLLRVLEQVRVLLRVLEQVRVPVVQKLLYLFDNPTYISFYSTLR